MSAINGTQRSVETQTNLPLDSNEKKGIISSIKEIARKIFYYWSETKVGLLINTLAGILLFKNFCIGFETSWMRFTIPIPLPF